MNYEKLQFEREIIDVEYIIALVVVKNKVRLKKCLKKFQT